MYYDYEDVINQCNVLQKFKIGEKIRITLHGHYYKRKGEIVRRIKTQDGNEWYMVFVNGREVSIPDLFFEKVVEK